MGKSCKLLAVILGLLVSPMVTAKDTIVHISEPAKADGILSEKAWTMASQQTIDYVVVPFNIDDLPVTTTVKYYEDGENLNIAFIADHDNADEIRAYYRQRDNIWQDDMVGIKIDPYNDQKLAYQFFINPLGVQSDATENTITGTESTGWDGIWYSAGNISEKNYIVEIVIPLNNFNFPTGVEPQTWAFEFVRFFPRDIQYRLSNVDIDPDNYCWVCQMQAIEGFAGASSGSNVTIAPALVSGVNQTRAPDAEWQSVNDTQPSLDIKWGLTTDSSLNITVNPDFSQVESDSGQLNVNNNFALFFEEKRPFFLENLDIFETRSDLIYTRNISSPNIGAKLSGRVDKHAYGVLVADDEITTLILPGNSSSTIEQINSKSTNVAVRYRYDLNQDISIGTLTTIRDSEDYHNYMSSVDLRYDITDQDSFNVQTMFSESRYSALLQTYFANDDIEQCGEGQCVNYEHYLRTANTDKFSGNATLLSYAHREQDWYTSIEYENVSDGFRADLGFVDVIDFQSYELSAGLNYYSSGDVWWNSVNIDVENEFRLSGDQQVMERKYRGRVTLEAIYNSYVSLTCLSKGQIGNRLDPSMLALRDNTDFFIQNRCAVRAGITPDSGLELDIDYIAGDRIDLANNRLGDSMRFGIDINYFINEHVSSKLSYFREDMDANGQPVFSAQLWNVSLGYNFDTRHALNLRLAYADIDYNPDNYLWRTPEPKYKDLGSQLIYSYTVNPQTAVYLGFSDFSEIDEVQRLQQVERNLFAKISYAWMP